MPVALLAPAPRWFLSYPKPKTNWILISIGMVLYIHIYIYFITYIYIYTPSIINMEPKDTEVFGSDGFPFQTGVFQVPC